jgi:hypothetical protein
MTGYGLSGVILYIIVREFIPCEEKGEPGFFVLGLAVYTSLSLILMAGGWSQPIGGDDGQMEVLGLRIRLR